MIEQKLSDEIMIDSLFYFNEKSVLSNTHIQRSDEQRTKANKEKERNFFTRHIRTHKPWKYNEMNEVE